MKISKYPSSCFSYLEVNAVSSFVNIIGDKAKTRQPRCILRKSIFISTGKRLFSLKISTFTACFTKCSYRMSKFNYKFCKLVDTCAF